MDILKELDRVLERQPDCWTAWTFRARCLLKMAQARTEARTDLLEQALKAARRAVEISNARPEAVRALDRCKYATGPSAPL